MIPRRKRSIYDQYIPFLYIIDIIPRLPKDVSQTEYYHVKEGTGIFRFLHYENTYGYLRL